MFKFQNIWKYNTKGISIFELLVTKFGYIFITICNFGISINCKLLWNESKSGKLIIFPKLYYRGK